MTSRPGRFKPVTITVFVKVANATHLDLGAQGLSPGDEDVTAGIGQIDATFLPDGTLQLVYRFPHDPRLGLGGAPIGWTTSREVAARWRRSGGRGCR
jgi:hypothetical protein